MPLDLLQTIDPTWSSGDGASVDPELGAHVAELTALEAGLGEFYSAAIGAFGGQVTAVERRVAAGAFIASRRRAIAAAIAIARPAIRHAPQR